MTNQITLATLAVTRPGATRFFLEHQLDFCCNGRRTLNEACVAAGLDPIEALRSIDALDAAGGHLTEIARQPLDALIEHIVDHYHARLRTDLSDVIGMAEKVERVHAERESCPRGLAALLAQMHAAVLDHLAKEEQVLFPLILAGRGPLAHCPVQMMEMEHEEHGRTLERLRKTCHDFEPPAEACTTWRALYLRLRQMSDELMEHIHLENNVLFPRALLNDGRSS